MKVSPKIQRKGVALLTVSESLQLMLSFGHIILTLVSIVIALIALNKKK